MYKLPGLSGTGVFCTGTGYDSAALTVGED